MDQKTYYLFFILYANLCECRKSWDYGLPNLIFEWKQMGYDFNGIKYQNDTNTEYKPHAIHFPEDLDVDDAQKFFIQKNNVPIGLETYGDRVFITVPRRRYGIPSTLNYVVMPPKAGGTFSSASQPLLKPYPDSTSRESRSLVSVYRPRVDACHRLWMVDTGHLEVPGVRKQLQPPAIVIYDLKTDQQILRQELNPSVLVNERTSAGLTSITVDVDPKACDDAFAYINDLATEGLVVFSLKTKESWRLDHPSFKHDDNAVNFTAAGHLINWKDGMFSIALSARDAEGKRTAYYHPMVSTQEFSVDTAVLKTKGASLEGHTKLIGDRGPNSQSGSHALHQHTGAMFFANLAADAIACWNVDTPLTPENFLVVAQDRYELGYISDLKVSGDYVWVLTNGIPKFVYNTQNTEDFNYYIKRYRIKDLIDETVCNHRHIVKGKKEN